MPQRKDNTINAPASLPVYESHPPPWLPRIHRAADLGYSGFHPPHPGQDEDVLSESNVKNGFILEPSVSAETFSAQAMINESLRDGTALSRLEGLMNEIFIRRTEIIPSIPPSTFRIPTRVTLNDSKRQAWFADLANPDVPLHKLGKSVPHGAKGQDLLDLLHSNNVAIPRAVWFLRVFGANETAGLRNKPGYNPTQYSVDWTNIVTGYMKKQLTEIALPSAPRVGLNIKQTFKGVLADADTRDRWISRFTYCLRLLRTFYAEGLIDHKTFLVWLVQQMGSCNLAQSGFIARLADEYLEEAVASRALSRPLVEACLSKLSEIQASSAQEHLIDAEKVLKIILQRLCLSTPEAFISPHMWSTYAETLQHVMAENFMDLSNDRFVSQNIQGIQHLLSHNLADIKMRNETMLFFTEPVQVSARLGVAVSDVKLLNSISSSTDMRQVSFFDPHPDDISFNEKIDMLLTWSVTPLQYGDHRPFAAVTLIRLWRDKACERATRRDLSTPSDFLQDRLFDWLDASDVAGEPSNIRAVSLLYGKLVKHELFSYATYIQRLIARDDPGLRSSESFDSRHRRFLSWIPLVHSTSSLANQRKVALHGVRARETPEDATERQIRKEIRSILPELFGTDRNSAISTANILDQCNSLLNASRFEQVRTFRQWLLPILQKYIIRFDDMSVSVLQVYSVAVEIMVHAKCFHSVLDISLHLLQHSMDDRILLAVLDTFYRYATIWTCMDMMGTIVRAFRTSHELRKSRGIQSRALLTMLMEFDHDRHLDPDARERALSDITAFTLALQPSAALPELVPDILPEILVLANDPDPDAPSLLANGLWIKYRTSYDWAWKVWDNTIASLRQIPAMTSDPAERRVFGSRYATFLWQIDQYLPHGLDADVLRWFRGPGKNEVAALDADVWSILTIVLLHLSVHNALKTTTILEGLVYPAWQIGASPSMEGFGTDFETYLRAAHTLCGGLLLDNDEIAGNVFPAGLLNDQCIRSRRQVVYQEHHFPRLVSSIPLLISIENNESIPEDLRNDSAILRHRLCRNSDFRQASYRDLDIIREAFENSPHIMSANSESLTKSTIAGLRMILCDSAYDTEMYDWPEVTSLLSPWKVAATAIEMQFLIKQLGRALIHESTQDAASANLDKLTLMLLHHTKTSEEAFYVGEMARGADSIVAGKFINNGLKFICELLSEVHDGDFDDLTRCLGRVTQLLRVLVYVAQPFRLEPPLLPQIQPSIQETAILMLCSKIAFVESLLKAGDTTNTDVAVEDLVFITRLLQFVLGFPTVWSSTAKEAACDTCNCLLRLALYFGADSNINLAMYTLLLDTLCYISDEIPPDPKAITADLFRNYPDLPIGDLPTDLPQDYRSQLLCLLPHLPRSEPMSNLVYSQRDSQGHLLQGSPVLNRPWEWIENLGEPLVLDAKEEERDREEKERQNIKYLVKNSGSLSLDSFGARLTDEGILRNASEDRESYAGANLLSHEDRLSSDNILTRDWREARADVDILSGLPMHLAGEVNQDSGSPSHATLSKVERRSTSRASPSSSVVSRSSARGSTSSIRQSPSHAHNRHSNSTVNDIIDVDSVSVMSSSKKSSLGKRKAPTTLNSDDEVEFVDSTIVSHLASNTKKARKAPVKPKAKKK